MAKARKRHEQQSLRFPDKNGQFRGRRVGDKRKRGGKRLGRPPKVGRRPSERHEKRPVLKAWQPVHIVQRVNPEVGSLRKRHMYRALREATIAVALRELNTMADGEFRIVHISIQRMHIHLLVEAEHQEALSRGMQSFGISLAKHVNCAYSKAAGLSRRRRGNVIADRFHQEIITSPRQARHALAYVLKNASHCTILGKRAVFPTSWAETGLLQAAERAVDYRRPSLEDLVWDRSPAIAWANQIDLQIRYGRRVPEELYS